MIDAATIEPQGATRVESWTCPICHRRTARTDALRHGITAHPATLPRHMTIADRLRLIPALAREAELTAGAPNPSAQADRTKRVARAHPPLPIDTSTIDALQPHNGDGIESWAPIARLVECSRLVWDALGPDQRTAHPLPVSEPWFDTECGWLLNAWPDAQAVLDPSAHKWIDLETRQVCAQLTAVARLSKEARYRCPDCGGELHLGEAGWMVCETGAHMHPGPDRLRDQWRRKPPMSTNHLAAQLHITPERIRKWHERGKLEKVRQEGRTSFWLPWDAVRCLYPDVVAAIENDELARVS